ncbi:MAG: hypothetical protein ACC608_00595 [Anaerofustis sp.]
MFFCDKGKKIMQHLLMNINKYPDQIYIVKLADASELEVIVDTCYETDNGLDESDRNFKEYHACLMRVNRIIKKGSKSYSSNDLFEINYLNYPDSITDVKGNEI